VQLQRKESGRIALAGRVSRVFPVAGRADFAPVAAGSWRCNDSPAAGSSAGAGAKLAIIV
jgi:hypothetical protein